MLDLSMIETNSHDNLQCFLGFRRVNMLWLVQERTHGSRSRAHGGTKAREDINIDIFSGLFLFLKSGEG
jgi:hypothetical protein